MRNKIILVLLGALLVQCCCLGSMSEQLESLSGEIVQQLTIEPLVQELPTIAAEPLCRLSRLILLNLP